jgi:hypothetical protein
MMCNGRCRVLFARMLSTGVIDDLELTLCAGVL